MYLNVGLLVIYYDQPHYHTIKIVPGQAPHISLLIYKHCLSFSQF